MKNIYINNVSIRTNLQSGDIGMITWLHGIIYQKEYSYSPAFESYVAAGLHEFYKNYDPQKDRIWIVEYKNKISGCLVLMHRSEGVAQLRYFLLTEECRGYGLGKRLMQLFMDFLQEKNYTSAFLWTTRELEAAAKLYRSVGFQLKEEIESSAFGISTIEQKYEWERMKYN